MNFDGDNAPPTAPENNCTNLPAPGTREHAAWVEADKANRARYGSGINAQRLASIEADKKAVEKSRAEHGIA